ncbi:MAG: hypothetical protein MSA49_01185 [Clostridia bacterium]|nr:hypothetical protein [Clostridia bacterium]
MIAWWMGLDLSQQIFALVGIAASVILLIQTLMLLFGLGGGSDADGDGDFDSDGTEGDIDGDGDHGGDGLTLFSIRGIVAMLCILGWTGVIFLGTSMPTILAVFLALLCGFLTLVGMAYIMRAISKLQSSGNLDIGNAVGKVGQVYIPIKPNGMAGGKITLTVQGKYSEFSAITMADHVLTTGSYVRVVSVNESNVLLVEPIAKPTEASE